MKRFYYLFFLFLFPALILGQNKIRIIADSYAPFSFEERGIIKGICPEIIQAVLKRLKLQSKIEIYPWSRAYHIGLNQKNIMLITLIRNEMRDKKFKWGAPLVAAEQAIFSTNNIQKVKSLRHLKDFKIGTVQNDIVEQHLETKGFIQGSNLIQVSTYEENVSMLINKRVDYIAASTATILYYANALKIPTDKLKKVYVFKELDLNIYMAFSLDTPENTIKMFINALNAFKKEKQFKKILQKYL